MKKTRILLIVSALLFSIPAHATAPTTNIPLFAQRIIDNVQRGIEHSKKVALKMQEMHAEYENKAMQIDNTNNGVANWIARQAQALQDVLGLEQASRAAPAEIACSNQVFSANMEDILCGRTSVMENISEKTGSKERSPIEIYRELKRVASNLPGGIGFATTSGNRNTKSKSLTSQRWEDHENELIEALDRLDKEYVLDPNLFLIGGAETYEYPPDKLNQVLDITKIIYPEYVTKSHSDPVNDKDIAQEQRNETIVGMANAIIHRHIAKKVTESDDDPSEILALGMATELTFGRFGDEGDGFSSNPSIALKRLTLGSDVGAGELSRTDVSRKALALHQMMEDWKSMLIREQALATLLITRLDPPRSATE